MEKNEALKIWEQRFAKYKKSGKTISTWCKEHSITEGQFHYWRRKLSLEKTDLDNQTKWLPLDLDIDDTDNDKKDSISPESILIHVGQVTIEIKKGFNKELFLEIIQVLKSHD